MVQFLTNVFNLPPAASQFLLSIAEVWHATWWLILIIIAALFLFEMWVVYLNSKWAKGLNFKLLEIKIPKNVLKTPKAMEQIFAAAHASYTYGIRTSDYYIKGQREFWMSFELIGRAGESRFYLRVPAKQRNMMESAIYGQFPEAEIVEAEDYLHDMPHNLPNKDLTVDGFEEILKNPEYLPIRTYPMFEDPTEERRIDTMAPILETMSRLKDDEQLWFQLIIMPTGEKFREEGEEAIKKILHVEDEEKKRPSIMPNFNLGFSAGEIVRSPLQHPGHAKERKSADEKMQKFRFIIPTHEKERADAIQKKIAKLAHEATIRFMYVEKRDKTAHSDFISPIHGFIRQFNTQDLNSLRPEKTSTTAGYAVRGLFKKRRLFWRRWMLYEHYRFIVPSHHAAVLNIEELATIFHFPTAAVSTSELEKVESRKGTPPASLPIVEDQ